MECTVSLQKVFFEWLSQLILWHLLSPVCIGGQLCMYRIQDSTYSLSDSLWILDKLPRCKYACRSHVALILWASPREEGNNQLEHMARSNECSHKTHIIIYIYISLEWLLSKGIVLTFTACIKLNVNKKKRHTKSSPAPQFLRPSIFNVAVVLPCRKVDTTLLASMKTREKIPCREDDSIFHAYSTQPKNLP